LFPNENTNRAKVLNLRCLVYILYRHRFIFLRCSYIWLNRPQIFEESRYENQFTSEAQPGFCYGGGLENEIFCDVILMTYFG